MVVGGRPTEIGRDRIELDGQAVADWVDEVTPGAVWFRLIQGRRPSPGEARMVGAVLAAMADHGETPASTQAARLVASTGVPLNAALASGFLAFGEHHAGAIEGVMRLLQDNVPCIAEARARDLVEEVRREGRRIPGIGHRIHGRDPRVAPLKRLALETGVAGAHLRLVLAIEAEMGRIRSLHLNVDGICGAILSDLGFPWEAGRAFFMAGRLPGLVAHVLRESNERRPFTRYDLVPAGITSSA